MLAAERYERITTTVRSQGVVSTERLARDLAVSPETVRRDLVALEKRGALRRVHGGAAPARSLAGWSTEEASFDTRASAATVGKRAIGARAAELVEDGQTIVIDVGTTALEVARAIPTDFRGTVATCSLLAASELADRPHVEVLVSGGRLRGGDLALSNADTVAFFSDLRADLAFLGSGGVDATAGVTDFHRDEVATRRAIIANAVRSYVLADASKLGRIAPHRVCALGQVAGVITDASAPRELVVAVEGAGGSVLDGPGDPSTNGAAHGT